MRLEFSGCPPFRAVLRDVACVVQLWRTHESFRLRSMTSRYFISLRLLAVLRTCIRGKHGEFVSGWDTKHRVRRDCMCCSSGVSCGLTPVRKCAFVPQTFLREWRNMGQAPFAGGRRVATSAVVAVTSQLVVKCACTDLDDTKVAQRP